MNRNHTIHALDPTTVRRIHSGQVIVSIESIVKELIENALDASATSIEVRIVDNGLALIQVKDDGHGVDMSSRALVGQRYHTSKIASIDDLDHIHTLGFRGEAINSICAVSAKVQLATKTVDDRLAMQYDLDRSGNQTSETPTGLIARSGTIVSVTEPFTHLPVRRQVVEKSFSFKRLQELLTKYALTYPSVRFSIASTSRDSRAKEARWVKPATSHTVNAISLAYGRQLADMLEYHRIEDETNRLSIECVLPKPNSDPGVVYRGDHVHVNVNHRPVSYPRCELKEVVALVRKKYNSDESSKKTPFMYINIQLDSDQFDVNLEPNKSAVLFHHKQQIIDLFEALVNRVYANNQRMNACQTQHTPPEPQVETDTEVADKNASVQSPVHASDIRSPSATHDELDDSPSPAPTNNDDREQSADPIVENDEDESLGAWKFSMGSQDTSTSSEEQDQLIPSDDDDDLQITQENSGPHVPTLTEWLERSGPKPTTGSSSAQRLHAEPVRKPVSEKQAQQPARKLQQHTSTPSYTPCTTRNNPAQQPARGQGNVAAPTSTVTHHSRRNTQQPALAEAYRNAQQTTTENAQSTNNCAVQQVTNEESRWQIEDTQLVLQTSRSTPVPLQQREPNVPEPSRQQQQKPVTLLDMFRMQKSASTPVSTDKGKGRAQPVTTPTKNLPKKRKRNKVFTGQRSKNQLLFDTLNFGMSIECNQSAILANYASQRNRHERCYRTRLDRYPCLGGSVKDIQCFPLGDVGNESVDIYVKARKQGCNISVEEVGVVVGTRMKYACSLSWYLGHHELNPNKRLDKPISMEISKEDPYFKVIASLEMSEQTQIAHDGEERLFKVVNDRRLVSNGFQCRWRMIDRVTMLLQITAIHTLNGDYGVADFRELLSILQEHPWIDNLSHCRPSSVEKYYRELLSFDESSQHQNHQAFSDDVLQWDDYVTDNETYQVGISDLLEDSPIVCCALFRAE